MIKLLMVGSRDWKNRGVVSYVLDHLFDEEDEVRLIVGDAPGLDRMALDAAVQRGWTWEIHWPRAGYRHNQVMLDRKPDVCIGFGDSHDTEDYIRRAKEAGILTIEVREKDTGGGDGDSLRRRPGEA